MNAYKYIDDERQAIAVLRAVGYWVENWDDETEILLGVSIDFLSSVGISWPEFPGLDELRFVTATAGSLREILWGPSSVPVEKIEGLLGISYENAGDLCDQILARGAHL